MLRFHQEWFFVAVVSTGGVGLWGLLLAVLKRTPGKAFRVARLGAIGAILLQVAAGVVLYARGLRPGSALHVFYGIVIVFTLAFAYVYRAQFERRPALAYGLLLLFLMGLGLRAWANVG